MVDFVDLDRYPITDLSSPESRALVGRCRRGLAIDGSLLLPGFIRADVIGEMAREVTGLQAHRRLEVVSPYFFRPGDPNPPADHPTAHRIAQDVHAVANDLIPADCRLRRVYDDPTIMAFLAAVLQVDRLFQFEDEFQCLNVMYMHEGGSRAWHYDGSDFVCTLLLQPSVEGGEFEWAPFIRGPDGDENFDAVAKLFRGQWPTKKTRAQAGGLALFNGRRSMHRVRAVYGPAVRIQSVLSYDTKPGQKSFAEKNIKLYGKRVADVYAARQRRDAAAAAAAKRPEQQRQPLPPTGQGQQKARL